MLKGLTDNILTPVLVGLCHRREDLSPRIAFPTLRSLKPQQFLADYVFLGKNALDSWDVPVSGHHRYLDGSFNDFQCI
jgi:hypothetical protein